MHQSPISSLNVAHQLSEPELDISLVIPLYNEEESLSELHDWITRTLSGDYNYEVIYVDDGSRDKSWTELEKIRAKDERAKCIRFSRNYGKSAGLNVGFKAATGRVVITMDADLQDSPEEIPALYKMITEEGYDLVSGWKQKRYDPISKTLPTKLYNGATRALSGIKLHDFNCGLKAYNWDTIQYLDIYGEMHRYIPVIAKREGFDKIGEKVVQHQARKYGHTKFGYERFVNGALDLMTISFISRFGKRPMHLFGTLGILMFALGFFLFAWVGGAKLYAMAQDVPSKNIASMSSFYIALAAMIIGTQFFLSGFVAELVSRNAPNKSKYNVKAYLK